VTVDDGGNIVPAVGGPSPGARDNPGTESFPNQNPNGGDAGTGGQGGGTGAGGSTTTTTAPTDWSSLLGIYGLPPDVAAKVAAIFSQTTDVSQATALALAYVRGTSWYAQTYPGIQEGIARGIIGNEADYRSYLNNVNILAKQYLGRDISGQELSDYLKQGFNVDRISRIFQGGAIAQTNGQDWRYATGAFDSQGALTGDEQAALGQEQAGIDTALGQRVQRRLALAQQRMQTIFQGGLATPGLSTSSGRIASTSLGSQANDVAA
jgi:hypothetical protein